MFRWAAIILLTVSASAMAADPEPAKPRNKILIMLETEIVPGKKLKGPASEYRHDGDPNTIELVILGPDDEGPSRVSDDGEVIFQRGKRVSQSEMDALMDQAFEIRFKREHDGKAGGE